MLKITNLANKNTVVCYARGQSQDLFIGKKTIALEYDATVILEVDMRSPVNLRVTPPLLWILPAGSGITPTGVFASPSGLVL